MSYKDKQEQDQLIKQEEKNKEREMLEEKHSGIVNLMVEGKEMSVMT